MLGSGGGGGTLLRKDSSQNLSHTMSLKDDDNGEGSSLLNHTVDTKLHLHGNSSLLTSTFNLSKTIIGAGFLSLPFGIASYADNPLAIIPSVIFLLLIGWIAIYSFKSIGRACELYHAKTFAEVWSRVVDAKTARLLPLLIVIKTLLGCLAFSIVIGDLFLEILASFQAPNWLLNRHVIIILFTTFVLFPLTSMRKLDALKYSSAFGLFATIYCAFFIIFRYLDRSYQEGGYYFQSISADL